MRSNLREKITHLILSIMLGCGIFLPVLGTIGLFIGNVPLHGVILICLLCLFLTATSWNRIIRIIGASALLLFAIIWITAGAGNIMLSDVLRAATLRIAGIETALPLVADETAIILSFLIGLFSYLFTIRRIGPFPALVLCIATCVLIWLQDKPEFMPWFLSAIAACLIQIMNGKHERIVSVRVVLFAVLITCIAFFVTPSGGVTIPALKERTDEFRQDILDRLFFTNPRNVFSLANEGFYPQGINQLGGRAEPTSHPVMQVSAPREVYLRGVIFDEYDGHSWKNTTGGRRYLWDSGQWLNERKEIFDEYLPAGVSNSGLTKNYTVSVRLVSDNTSTLFVPQRIRELRPGGTMVPYFSRSSEVYITRDVQAGDTYSVDAPLFLGGDSGLNIMIDSASTINDANYSNITKTYLQLPSHLEKQVYDLAANCVRGCATPYEKACAIQNWLARNYRYTMDIEDQPVNVDFVTHFLMTTKSGYCTHFASAMTILCRINGLPARYVEGYLAVPDKNGFADVTGKDGHAWTEVYFPGFGWVTFDSTPQEYSESEDNSKYEEFDDPENNNDDTPEEEQEENEPDPPEEEYDEIPEDDIISDPESEDEHHNRNNLWILLVLLALITLAAVGRIVWCMPVIAEKRARNKEELFNMRLQELFDILRASGIIRRRSETPSMYMHRADTLLGTSGHISSFGYRLSVILYAHDEPTDNDLLDSRALADALKAVIALPRKLKLCFIRSFIPISKRSWTSV